MHDGPKTRNSDLSWENFRLYTTNMFSVTLQFLVVLRCFCSWLSSAMYCVQFSKHQYDASTVVVIYELSDYALVERLAHIRNQFSDFRESVFEFLVICIGSLHTPGWVFYMFRQTTKTNLSCDTSKRVFGSFRPGQTQTVLRSHRS